MRILLIEDDIVVVDYVGNGLRAAGHSVLIASDGMTGLDYALNESFDLAIIDLMLPALDGMSVIRQVRDQGIKAPVIILSAKRDVDDRVQGLREGGDDYLTKPFSFTELLARVEAVSRRSVETSPTTKLTLSDLELDLLARKVTRSGTRIELQPKEFALLEYLLRNAGNVVSKTMIMERVWNYTFDPCTNVVEARISKLREKVDKDFDQALIHTVRGAGYVIRLPDSLTGSA